jgi:taurine--2-oxoglutarate transaminase
VNSGYVPLGGVIISDPIAHEFDERIYPGGLTYSGHPLACAAAKATITAMRDEKIVENAARVGAEVFAPGFAALAGRHPSIGEVRGLGVFWALELVTAKDTRAPLAAYPGTSPQMAAINAACRANGLLPLLVVNRIHVVPPCTITDVEAKEALSALDAALTSVDL